MYPTIQNLKKRISHFSLIELNHKTPKISQWAYIFQRAFYVASIQWLGDTTSYPRFLAFLMSDFTIVQYQKKQETLQPRLRDIYINIYRNASKMHITMETELSL